MCSYRQFSSILLTFITLIHSSLGHTPTANSPTYLVYFPSEALPFGAPYARRRIMKSDEGVRGGMIIS
jgi:hypothetical protein